MGHSLRKWRDDVIRFNDTLHVRWLIPSVSLGTNCNISLREALVELGSTNVGDFVMKKI